MKITSINPNGGKKIKDYKVSTEKDIKNKIDALDKGFNSWKKLSYGERALVIRNAAQNLRENRDKYARMMSLEMGKPVTQARGEIEKCAWVCEYYAENAAEYLEKEKIETDLGESYVVFRPMGVILAIMPWNFPFWQVFRFAAPALMAGNVCLLKHAPNVPGSSQSIEEIFKKAGGKDIFKSIIIPDNGAENLIKNKKIAAVTFTGSTSTGRKIAKTAGETLKKCVLEMGGSDPYIIAEDADLEEAAEICVSSRVFNSGQTCIAAKRFICAHRDKKKFETFVKKKMSNLNIGDPLDQKTEIGPMARKDLMDNLASQVKKSLKKGARCIFKADITGKKGYFYPPTVLVNVKKGMPAYDEELFGPVASIINVKDMSEAVRIANDTSFGLGAAIIGKDLEKIKKISEKEIEAGCVFINTSVKSDPRLPFGGIKNSGYGRELSGYGIKEFVNIKTIGVR